MLLTFYYAKLPKNEESESESSFLSQKTSYLVQKSLRKTDGLFHFSFAFIFIFKKE